MPTLVAHYDIEMPGGCLSEMPDGEFPLLEFPIEGFSVSMRLEFDPRWKSKHKDAINWTQGVDRALVAVSKQEVSLPPQVVPDDEDTLDYSIQSDYFKNRVDEFEEAAREAVNRVIRYFQYRLNTPLLSAIPAGHPVLRTPRWTDERGNLVGKSGSVVRIEKIPGRSGELGVRRLTPQELPLLAEFLTNPTEFSLTEQILSGAQSAWFEGNLRRSVLELAIACEILVKRRFFAGDTPAGAAFDYLEDRAKVSVRILDFVDRVSIEAFSRSFRTEQPDKFRCIDHLFRCRNKIAHRGELSFRDDSGLKNLVDSSVVRAWWESVMSLKSWLDDIGTC